MKQKYTTLLQRLGLGIFSVCLLMVGVVGFGVVVKPARAAALPTIVAQAPPPEQQPQGEEKAPYQEIPKSTKYKECEGGGDCEAKMFEYINFGITALSAMAGVIFVIMVVWGGIEYSSAGGDAQRVAAAKSKVTNAIIGLIAFGLLYGFLSWIVPGGIG